MAYVILVAVIVAITAVIVVASRRRRGAPSGQVIPPAGRPGALRPAVAEFHVTGGDALVHFEVPLSQGDVDEHIASLLGHEAIEVVREKRHTLPIDDVHRVVALGRRNGAWVVVTTIGLDTPGTLPPPVAPEHIPHASRVEFDVFDHFAALPEQTPVADVRGAETLGSFMEEMSLPGRAAARLRAQGIAPESAAAPEVALGLMRAAGYTLEEIAPDTYLGHGAGQKTFVRVVPHGKGHHPELGEQDIRRFVMDFGSSGASRGLLITEKYSPFEIYERERRDPRIRFVTRERLQGFIDALALN